MVASALGIPTLLPFLKAVCQSKKSWQARHTGIKIVQQIAILMGCAVLPHLKSLVDIIKHGGCDGGGAWIARRLSVCFSFFAAVAGATAIEAGAAATAAKKKKEYSRQRECTADHAHLSSACASQREHFASDGFRLLTALSLPVSLSFRAPPTPQAWWMRTKRSRRSRRSPWQRWLRRQVGGGGRWLDR